MLMNTTWGGDPRILAQNHKCGEDVSVCRQAAEAVLIPGSFWEMKVLDSSLNDTGKDPITVKLSASQPPLPRLFFYISKVTKLQFSHHSL